MIPLLALIMYPAFAHDGHVHDASFFWQVKKFFYDVRENFAPPGYEKAKIEAQHALEYQADYEKGEFVTQVHDAIEEKMANVQAYIDTTKSNGGVMLNEDGVVMTPAEKYNFDVIGETVSALRQAVELNEIRKLYKEFDGVLYRNDPAEVAEFNKKVNDLEVYRHNCTDQFDIRNFRNDPDSFKRLQDLCPPLKTKSATELQKILDI